MEIHKRNEPKITHQWSEHNGALSPIRWCYQSQVYVVVFLNSYQKIQEKGWDMLPSSDLFMIDSLPLNEMGLNILPFLFVNVALY
jgi:hypothetical protein